MLDVYWFLVPGSWFLVPRSWFRVSRFWFLVSGFWFLVPGFKGEPFILSVTFDTRTFLTKGKHSKPETRETRTTLSYEKKRSGGFSINSALADKNL